MKACLHPNAKKNLGQVYSQLWKDVRKHRALVVDRDHPGLETTISSPFEAVDKLLPDRTISPDKRVVHDQRGVNYYTDKTWHPPAAQPSHAQVAKRILLWKLRAPGLPVLLAKKDVAGAFRLLWVSPEDVELFAGDVPWSPSEMGPRAGEVQGGKEMTIIYLVSSFGFSGSPGEWAIRRWRRGELGIEDRRAGGEMREVTRLGDALWWEALKLEARDESDLELRWAGKRRGKLVKKEDAEGPGKIVSEAEKKVPFTCTWKSGSRQT